jgi:hypothetical protein
LIAQDKVLRCDFTGKRGQMIQDQEDRWDYTGPRGHMVLHRTKRTYGISQIKRIDGIREDQQDRGIRQDKKYRSKWLGIKGQTRYTVQDQDDRWDNSNTRLWGQTGLYCTGPKGESGLPRIMWPGRIKQD